MGTGEERALGGSNADFGMGEAADAGEAVTEAVAAGEGEADTDTDGDADGVVEVLAPG